MVILITLVHLCGSANRKPGVFIPRTGDPWKKICARQTFCSTSVPSPLRVCSLFCIANFIAQAPNLTRTVPVEPCTSQGFYSAKWHDTFYLTENCVVLLSVKLRSKSVWKLHGLWLNKTPNNRVEREHVHRYNCSFDA